jgi:AAA family ATP:ADP antiporter
MTEPANHPARFTSAHELVGAAWAFLYFFFMLSSYYMLRPVREEMGVRTGVENLQWLYTGTLLGTLIVVPLFGWMASRWPRPRLLPAVYALSALVLWAFYLLLQSNIAPRVVAAGFFIFVSTYNVFIVSVFWAFMADIFAPEQAKRLYGWIAAGGSAGAIAGPAITTLLVKVVGVPSLLLLSSALLMVSVICIVGLSGWARRHGRAATSRIEVPLGGSAWAGIPLTLRSPYFLAIAGFVVIMSLLNTFAYFEQAKLVKDAIADSAGRTQLFAKIDLAVSVISLASQLLLVRLVLSRAGVGITLGAIMLLSAIGFAWLAVVPTLAVFIVVQVFRRSTDYAFVRPAREALYTVVSREEKYKAKNFIDLFAFRGGDAATGWLHKGLGMLNATPSVIFALAVPFALLGTGLGWYLGRQQEHRQAKAAAPASGTEHVVVA